MVAHKSLKTQPANQCCLVCLRLAEFQGCEPANAQHHDFNTPVVITNQPRSNIYGIESLFPITGISCITSLYVYRFEMGWA